MRTLIISFVLVLGLGGLVYSMWPHSVGIQDGSAEMETDGPNNDVMMIERGEVMEQTDVMQDKDVLQNKDAMEAGSVMEKKGDVMMDKSSAVSEHAASAALTMTKEGTYEAYSPEKVVRGDAGDVVLFFRASWCPSCRAVDTDIKKNSAAIPAGLTILDVDYDTALELKKKYGVTYQHTFVQVDAQGNQIAKWSGSPTLAALVAQVK